MRLRLMKIRDALADSFWFVPALMAFIAGGMALGSIVIDHTIGSAWVKNIGWVWSGGAEGARSVLSTISGSIMTVVSIVFSLTVTTLAQTSSHFGPRVLRNFTSDRGVQFTLGTFIATFVYCLLVLRTVRSGDESSFVPYLAVNIGVLLALVSLAVLIFFIHHVSQSIQAENLIATVGHDFQSSVQVLFPARIGQSQGYVKSLSDDKSSPEAPDASRWEGAREVESSTSGYLQRVDDEQLLRLATQHDLLFKLKKRPGDFVANSEPLLQAVPPTRVTDAVEHHLRACFSLGSHRTPHQDALYTMQQLVEIAAHALSPGINEPFTALTCIDWLGASLREVAGREIPSALRCDKSGQLRVIARPLHFADLARTAFDQIRVYGASNPDVMVRLLEVIEELAPDLQRDEDRAVMRHHAQLIGSDAAQIANAVDRERVKEHVHTTLQALMTEQSTACPGG